ncbi:MAG: ABC transporter ATP-binding protein, partial [Clostridia bacterium]|nr:ABC transporter ATP-binding protein [Clostridia bacterium]
MTENVLDKKRENRRKKKLLVRMFSYVLRYKWLSLAALCLMLLSNILVLWGPTLSGKAINAIGDSPNEVDIEKVLYFCLLMIGAYVASAALSYINSVIIVNLSQKITYAMRKEIFEHLTELPVSYFDKTATGDIISHISYDVDTVNTSLSTDLLQLGAGIVTVIGSLIMMLTISPIMLSVFLFTIPVSVLFTVYKSKRIQPYFKARSGKIGELNGYAEEMLSGQKTIRAYSREDVIISRFDKKNEITTKAYYDAEYHGCVIGPSMNFINNVSLSLISMLGGMLYLYSISAVNPIAYLVIDLGKVASFIQYSRKFAGPINEFANIMSEIQSAMAAAERVFRIIDTESEPADICGAVTLENVKGDVRLERVKFGYDEGKEIIHDLSFHAKPGALIAIVGPTGAGKTTIINLLMRFYDTCGGKIFVEGREIGSVTRESLRAAYTMVLQDTWLFHGSIFENIAYGKEGATLDEVKTAARAAKIDKYIENLPDGYDTILSDDGVNISKGQKQLLTIARAMLADAPMLILDEATSNVDSRTEHQIQEAMYTLMRGRTCFVIAH